MATSKACSGGTEPGPVARAEGLELLGEYRGSGSTRPQYLLRRRDGRVVIVSAVLYAVVSQLDGRRSLDQIAARASSVVGRALSPGNVAHLLEHKLGPLGVLAHGAPSGPPSARQRRPLTIRKAVLPHGAVRAGARWLSPLFFPPVIAAVLGAFLAMEAWLFLTYPLAPALREVLDRPGLVLLVVAVTLAAGAFHEFGHAAAGVYGGARPGVIGVGVYLLWPVFFSDLTDSYRLDRGARLRADLGGVYFNVVFMLGLAGLYGLTGFAPLAVAVALQHLLILQQFLPFVRLDGYYIASDLLGVPDLFTRLKPAVLGLVGRGPRDRGLEDLKPRIRVLVTVWALVTVALMGATLVWLSVRMPQVVTMAWRYGGLLWTEAAAAVADRDAIPALLAAVRLLALGIAATGFFLTLVAPCLAAIHRFARRRAQRALFAGEHETLRGAVGPPSPLHGPVGGRTA